MAKTDDAKQAVRELLASADIKIDGNRPWDIQVHNPKFYSRVLADQSMGMGESYVDGWWDCKNLDQFFYKLLSSGFRGKGKDPKLKWQILKSKLINIQNKTRSKIVGIKHYDVGNELYAKMLDKRMVYTCGYWRKAKTHDKSQVDKLDLICKKMKLKPGMHVADLGCGFGSFAKYAAEKYKVKVVGVTISKEQAELGKKMCQGLPVDIRFQDYRDVDGKFDRVFTIGLLEHVGRKNYRTLMKKAHGLLNRDGLFFIHTIGNNTTGGNGFVRGVEPWLEKYIFPNAQLPSPEEITAASDGLFVLQDWHNFGGTYYDKTLMAWHKNFNDGWNEIKDKYDERFHRMWNYYLLFCAGNFRANQIDLWHIVYSKNGLKEAYEAVR